MGVIVIIFAGFIFGWLLSFGGLNKYNTIAGLSMLKDFTVAKTIMLVLGVGSLLLLLELVNGNAHFHIKPFYLIGTTIGGLIFGIGMSILGYCPGTLPVSLGQGSIDAFFGIIGGLIGGIVYTLIYPLILPLLGTDLGKISLYSLMGDTFSIGYIIITILIAIVMIVGAFLLHQVDVKNDIKSKRWILTAVGLALLNVLLFYKGWMNRPMGASASYLYVGDTILGITNNSYYHAIVNSGVWEALFLIGAMFAGFVYAAATGTFQVKIMYGRWVEYKGVSKPRRIIWALIGGFILIFGARIAGGCTSGHIISGGMQIAISSYVFAIFTFIGFLTTGYFFYTRHKKSD